MKVVEGGMVSGIFDLRIITGCIMRMIKKFLTTGVFA
jgi:hypothetical protein